MHWIYEGSTRAQGSNVSRFSGLEVFVGFGIQGFRFRHGNVGENQLQRLNPYTP